MNSSDPFDYLDVGRGLLLNDNTYKGTMGSVYQLMQVIGVTGIVVTFILCGIKLAWSQPGKRADALSEMKWKVLIAVVLFSMTTIIGWIIKIAVSFA